MKNPPISIEYHPGNTITDSTNPHPSAYTNDCLLLFISFCSICLSYCLYSKDVRPNAFTTFIAESACSAFDPQTAYTACSSINFFCTIDKWNPYQKRLKGTINSMQAHKTIPEINQTIMQLIVFDTEKTMIPAVLPVAFCTSLKFMLTK